MKFLYHCVGSLIDLDFKDTDDSKEFYYSYTSKGQYVRKKFHKISKVDLKNDVDENVVEQEHVRSYISIFTTLNTLGKEMGIGITLYFDYFKFIILLNFILTILQTINFFTGKIYYRDYNSPIIFPAILFASEFSPSHRLMWYIMNAIALFITIIAPFIYFGSLRLRRLTLPEKRNKRQRKLKNVSELVTENHVGEDTIPENVKEFKRYYLVLLKRAASYFIMLVLLIIQAAFAYGITEAQYYYYEALLSQTSPQAQALVTVGSIIIGLSLTIFNTIYGLIAVYLNQWECYATWTTYRFAYSFKFIIFRISQLIIVNIVKAQTVSTICPIYAFGLQYLSYLLSDMILGNILQILTPIIIYSISKCTSKTHNSNESLRSEFDISDQHIGLLYRQFLVYNAMASFPLAPLIAFIAGIIEYFIDKLKIIMITQRPKQVLSSKNAQLILITTTSLLSVIALLNIGGGPLYIIIGEYFFCSNYVPLGFNSTLAYCKTRCPIFYGLLNSTIIGNGTVNPIPILY